MPESTTRTTHSIWSNSKYSQFANIPKCDKPFPEYVFHRTSSFVDDEIFGGKKLVVNIDILSHNHDKQLILRTHIWKWKLYKWNNKWQNTMDTCCNCATYYAPKNSFFFLISGEIRSRTLFEIDQLLCVLCTYAEWSSLHFSHKHTIWNESDAERPG